MRTSPSVPGMQGRWRTTLHCVINLASALLYGIIFNKFALSHHVPTRELEDHEKNCPSMQMMSQILYTTENQTASVGAKVTS